VADAGGPANYGFLYDTTCYGAAALIFVSFAANWYIRPTNVNGGGGDVFQVPVAIPVLIMFSCKAMVLSRKKYSRPILQDEPESFDWIQNLTDG
jgi:hypothetical protein